MYEFYEHALCIVVMEQTKLSLYCYNLFICLQNEEKGKIMFPNSPIYIQFLFYTTIVSLDETTMHRRTNTRACCSHFMEHIYIILYKFMFGF